MELDARIMHYDFDELREVTALFHDRMFHHVDMFAETRLSIPRQTHAAHGMTSGWNQIETPITLHQVLCLCEWFHFIVNPENNLTVMSKTEMLPTEDELYAARIEFVNLHQLYTEQLNLNREQSRVIASLTAIIDQVGKPDG